MYSAEVNGEATEFGTSGFLYRSNKLMYDRSTNTLWHQFTGEPVVGPLADSGIKLTLLLVVLTTWEEWVADHPDTSVLDMATGVYSANFYEPENNPRSVYYRYRETPETMFPVPNRSDALAAKDQVLGVALEGQSRAYPLGALRAQPVINDSLAGQNLVLVTDPTGGARAYLRASNNFRAAPRDGLQPGIDLLLDETERRWRVEEEALVLVEGPSVSLPRVPSRAAYWFGWYSFYPSTDIYASGNAKP